MKSRSEKWKPFPRRPDILVSDQGRVKTRMGITPGCLRDNGYMGVGFMLRGKAKAFLVQRLVMETFRGPPPPGMRISRKNGDKSDNRLDNLEYKTVSEIAKGPFK